MTQVKVIGSVMRKWRELEERWWKNLSTEEVEMMEEEGLQVDNMLFFAEVLFTALQLKSMTMFSYLPAQLIDSYRSKVINPSGLLEAIPTITIQIIDQLETSNATFQSTMVLYNLDTIKYIPALSRLDEMIRNNNNNNGVVKVTESDLAILFDYPIAIPESIKSEHFFDVGYSCLKSDVTPTSPSTSPPSSPPSSPNSINNNSTNKDPNNRVIVTSFYIPKDKLKSMKEILKQHHYKYTTAFYHIFGSPLLLQIAPTWDTS